MQEKVENLSRNSLNFIFFGRQPEMRLEAGGLRVIIAVQIRYTAREQRVSGSY